MPLCRGRADDGGGRVRILALEQRGYRRFELAITALLAIVFCGFGYDLLAVGADPGGIATGLVPSLPGGSLLIAAGIIGATVMPHVVYLHSALTKSRVSCRDDAERRELLRFQRLDVIIALGSGRPGQPDHAVRRRLAVPPHRAGRTSGRSRPRTPESRRLVGGGAALAFAVALLASGLSSSSVGTYAWPGRHAGLHRPPRSRCSSAARSPCSPALVVLGLGLPVTASLVISQVVLSFGIPFALVPLLLLTRRRDIMGALVNRRADHRRDDRRHRRADHRA